MPGGTRLARSKWSFQGNTGTINATLSVPGAGTYQFDFSDTGPAGTDNATATFNWVVGGTSSSSAAYTINTLGACYAG